MQLVEPWFAGRRLVQRDDEPSASVRMRALFAKNNRIVLCLCLNVLKTPHLIFSNHGAVYEPDRCLSDGGKVVIIIMKKGGGY